MIFLRAAGVDNDDAVAVDFVAVETPIGVQDGDLLLLAVAIDQTLSSTTGVVVTPPDAGWTLAGHTDKTGKVVGWVFWKYALNEPARWVFALSAASFAQGLVAVYGGADGWEPIEAFTSASTDVTEATVNQRTPASATSVSAEDLALFLFAEGENTYTPATGYAEVTSRQNIGTLAFHRQAKTAAGPVAAGSVAYGLIANGASILVVLRPSAAKLSLDDVRGLLVGALPADADRVYDLAPGGDYFKLFQAIALTAKQVIFDLVELAQLEILPRFARYKLPDWERVFGLTTTRAAQVGTVPARQNQIVSRWREAAGLGSTASAITAILGPLLGYDPATPVQVVTTDRDLLRIEHSYAPLNPVTIPAGMTATWQFSTVDGGKVSKGGVRLTVEYVSGSGDLQFNVIAPDGTEMPVAWQTTLDAQAMDVFFGIDFVGTEMGADPSARWTVFMASNAVGDVEVIPTVFVEGMPLSGGTDQETAGAMFDWGVYADPVHLVESGVFADLVAARAAIDRIAFSHTDGGLIQSLEAEPDSDTPDECIPV